MREFRRLNIMLGIFSIICLCLFSIQVINYYQYNEEYKKLIELDNEYNILKKEIAKYNELKNNYLIVLEEEKGLLDNKSGLQMKVNELNKEIDSLQIQIISTKKKIDDIS